MNPIFHGISMSLKNQSLKKLPKAHFQRNATHVSPVSTNLRDDIKMSGRRGEVGKSVYFYRRISLFPIEEGNPAVKIDGGGG